MINIIYCPKHTTPQVVAAGEKVTLPANHTHVDQSVNACRIIKDVDEKHPKGIYPHKTAMGTVVNTPAEYLTYLTNTYTSRFSDVGVIYNLRFHGALKFFIDPKIITVVNPIQDLGTVITNPAFFTGIDNLNNSYGRIVGEHKSSGDGLAEICIEERVPGGSTTVLTTTPFQLPDTGGEWEIFAFSTDVPPSATDNARFVICGRLVTSTNTSEIRDCSISMLELLT